MKELLEHIQENIQLIEEDKSPFAALKKAMIPNTKLFNSEPYQHGQVGDVVYTSKLLGKVYVDKVSTSGLIFKDHTYYYTSDYRFPKIKETSIWYVGDKNGGAPSWRQIESNVKVLNRILPDIAKESNHGKAVKIDDAKVVVYDPGSTAILTTSKGIRIIALILDNGEYDIYDYG